MSKDIFGNELCEFDVVAYIEPYYSSLRRGIIYKVTPKGATIKPEPYEDGSQSKNISRLGNQIALKSRKVMVACDGKCKDDE